MRSHEHIVADDRRMPGAPADQGVLHHDAAGADTHLAVLGREHGPEQDTGVRSDVHRAAQHCGGCHVGAGINTRCTAPVLNKHAHRLPATSPQQAAAHRSRPFEARHARTEPPPGGRRAQAGEVNFEVLEPKPLGDGGQATRAELAALCRMAAYGPLCLCWTTGRPHRQVMR